MNQQSEQEAERAAERDDPDGGKVARIDREAVFYLSVGIVCSLLVHASVVGVIALVDHLDWSIRADFTWDVQNEPLRQVGIGPTTKSVPPPVEPPSQKNKQKEKKQPREPKVPETDQMKKALAGKLKLEPASADDTNSPEPESAAEQEQPEDAMPKKETTEEPEDQSSAGSQTDDEIDFDSEALGRAGPTDLPRLDGFAPGNARYTALIRLDRLRETRYRKQLGHLLSALPDYRLLAASTELDPIEQLDSIFFASARPQYLQYTFIAIRHELSHADVRRAVDARYPDPPVWRTEDGLAVRQLVPPGHGFRDPRRIVLAEPGLTLVSRPEWLDRIARAYADTREQSEQAASDRQPAETPRPGSLVGGLRRIEEVVSESETIVLMSAYGGNVSLPGVGRIRGFRGVRLEVNDPDAPTLNIDVHFENVDAARRFTADFTKIRRAAVDAIPFGGFLDLDKFVERLEARREGKFVQVRGSYTPEEVRRLAGMFSQFVPRPPVLDRLPEPKPPGSASRSGDSGDVGTRQQPVTPDSGNGEQVSE